MLPLCCGDPIQYKYLKFWGEERTDCPCCLEIIEDISKRRYALTHSFWVELDLYRQKTEVRMSWQRAARESSPRKFVRQGREPSMQAAQCTGIHHTFWWIGQGYRVAKGLQWQGDSIIYLAYFREKTGQCDCLHGRKTLRERASIFSIKTFECVLWMCLTLILIPLSEKLCIDITQSWIYHNLADVSPNRFFPFKKVSYALVNLFFFFKHMF